MWYSIINQTTDFVQISQKYMLLSIICFISYSRIHIVFSWIEQLQPHETNSDKFFSFLFCYKYFLIFLPMATSVQLSCSVMSDSLQPHGLQHARLPYPSPTPRTCSDSCPSSWWCHPTTSSSVALFSSHLKSFPASGSFPVSQFFTSGCQSIRVSASASVLPMNIQDWFTLGWIGWVSLQSKGLSRVFSNTTVQKHQLFGAQLSL